MKVIGSRQLLPILAVVALGALSDPVPGVAQQLTGTLVDAETTLPLPGVTVELVEAGGEVVARGVTEADGQFTLRVPGTGRYSIVVESLGYLPQRVYDVHAEDGMTSIGVISLIATAVRLNPLVVSPSRGAERAIDAPASVHSVGREVIVRRPTTLPVDHVKDLPGVDVISSGLARVSVAARGFNGAMNGKLLVLTDNRWSSLPSLRFNSMNLIPTTDEDVERLEVVLGPGSALYGPNSANGVLHIITRSPLDSQGGSASMTFGERSLFQSTMRYAGKFGDDVGYKISGTYFRGNDWQYTDPVEAANRDAALGAGADPDTLLIGARDFDTERFSVDGRLDARLDEATTLTFSAGMTELSSGIEQIETNTAQASGWKSAYFQTRFRSEKSFAQAYVNWSDAGDSYLLRSGGRLVDSSLLAVAQGQHAFEVGERQRFAVGVDMTRTMPRTDGTIHGENESEDNIMEVGGYVQSETQISDRLMFVAAARVDHHNRLESAFFSPRAAVVFSPADAHKLRFTYNRSFLLPSAINLFADLVSSPNLGGLPFAIRAAGVPNQGFVFRRDCQGTTGPPTLCMRSPFAPSGIGGPSQALPLDATLFWAAAVEVLKAQDAAAGSLLEQMAAPTADQIGTVMRTLNAGTGMFDLVQDVVDIDGLGASVTNTFEVGYKGLIEDRLFLSVDLYRTRVSDLISPFFVFTPNVFLDPQSVGAYLASEAGRLGLPLTSELIAALTQGLAGVPLGTVVPESGPGGGADLLLTIRNFGEVNLWGTDLRATLIASDEVSISASYSYVNEDLFEDVGGVSDVPLNAPKNKGSARVDYWNPRRGIGFGVGGRVVASFPFASGVFAGTIDSYTLVEANVSYVPSFLLGAQVSLSATNLLNERHQEAIGAPFLGRLVSFRLRKEF